MTKYLGIDYGAKRVGLAVSSEAIAFPRATLANDEKLLSSLVELIEKEKIEHVVIGDTRSHGGTKNPITAEAEKFIEELQRATGVPVARAFEVFSSIEASRYTPENKGHDDASAAAVILQRYLEMNAGGVQ